MSAPQQALLVGSGFDPSKDPFWRFVEALISFEPTGQGYYQSALYGSNSGWAAMTRRQVYTGVSSELRTEFWKSPAASGPYHYYQYDDSQYLWYNALFDSSRITKTATGAFGWTQGTGVAATLVKVPLDLMTEPNIVSTNIILHDIRILASNGVDLYAVGSISGFSSPNQVYKSVNDGLTWTALGILSGTTLPYDIGGSSSPAGQALIKVGSRWFLIFGQNGLNSPATTCRVFYTDSTDPVSGWQPTTGLEVVDGSAFDNASQVIGFDGQRHYAGKYYQTTGNIFSSTDGGNTWSSEYTIPAGFNQARLWGIETTSTIPGLGTVRAIAGGEPAMVYEKTIGTTSWVSIDTGMTGARTGYYNNSTGLSPTWGGFAWASTPWSSTSAGTTGGQALAYANTQDSTGATWQVSSTSTGAYSAVSGIDIPLVESGTPTAKSMILAPNGTSYIDTANYKWAGGSLRTTNGPAQIITTQGNDFNLGDEPWTIELWVYTSISNQVAGIINNLTGGDSSYYPFNFGLNNGKLCLYGYNSVPAMVYSLFEVATLPLNTWNYIAFQRNSEDVITLYLNGDSVGTNNLLPGTELYWDFSPINIGAYNDGSYPFNGWIDDIRITRGRARYSGSTILVPTQAFPNE